MGISNERIHPFRTEKYRYDVRYSNPTRTHEMGLKKMDQKMNFIVIFKKICVFIIKSAIKWLYTEIGKMVLLMKISISSEKNTRTFRSTGYIWSIWVPPGLGKDEFYYTRVIIEKNIISENIWIE